jgi:hypothetical protein
MRWKASMIGNIQSEFRMPSPIALASSASNNGKSIAVLL